MKVTRVKLGTKQFILNEKQRAFIRSPAKYVGYIGGRGCGKTLAAIIKAIELSLKYENNAGLIGREDYSDLRDSTEKDFFDACPREYIRSYQKMEHRATLINGSTIIFRGLKDVSKTSIRSLNLGWVLLEQAEEIDETLVDELSGCLRRQVRDADGNLMKQQMFMLANPWMGWIFKRFKQEQNPEYELIQGSMMDNRANLGESFIKDQLSKPEWWKKVMVYGDFDERSLNEAPVFDQNLLDIQTGFTRNILRTTAEVVDIYEEPVKEHIYQIGADPSEGINDYCVAKCINTFTGKEVASYVGRIQPDLFGGKVISMGEIFNKAKVVLEINGIGLATLDELKRNNYERIFMREEYDKITKVITQKLGWKTSSATKPLLISNFNRLMEEKFVQLSDEKSISEMRSFRYTLEAKKRGMGAIAGFHDDRVMATALAYWAVNPMASDENLVIDNREIGRQKEILTLKDVFEYQGDQDWRQF